MTVHNKLGHYQKGNSQAKLLFRIWVENAFGLTMWKARQDFESISSASTLVAQPWWLIISDVMTGQATSWT